METEGKSIGGCPLRDFGHVVVAVAVVLLQRRRGHCSNFVEFSVCLFCYVFFEFGTRMVEIDRHLDVQRLTARLRCRQVIKD